MKYSLADYYPEEIQSKKDLQLRINMKLLEQLKSLPDCDSDDESLMVRFGEEGPEFDFFLQVTKKTLIDEYYALYFYDFKERLPKLFKMGMRKLEKVMDDMRPDEEIEEHIRAPLRQYLFEVSQNETACDRLLNSDIHLYYKKKAGQGSHEPMASSSEGVLDSLVRADQAMEMTGA
mmetsp:Transcript_7961/g.12309  ORF Transcript_7961/g.12309 Transcript_7961/m.12309 type:complete len:176 (+) Transcript_7961:581-1108(+)